MNDYFFLISLGILFHNQASSVLRKECQYNFWYLASEFLTRVEILHIKQSLMVVIKFHINIIGIKVMDNFEHMYDNITFLSILKQHKVQGFWSQ